MGAFSEHDSRFLRCKRFRSTRRARRRGVDARRSRVATHARSKVTTESADPQSEALANGFGARIARKRERESESRRRRERENVYADGGDDVENDDGRDGLRRRPSDGG